MKFPTTNKLTYLFCKFTCRLQGKYTRKLIYIIKNKPKSLSFGHCQTAATKTKSPGTGSSQGIVFRVIYVQNLADLRHYSKIVEGQSTIAKIE